MADGTVPSWPAMMQLASSALPIGGFSYSTGLEAAVSCGRIRDAADALAWIGIQLDPLWATGDARLWLQCHAAWTANDCSVLRAVNARLLAQRDSAELRLESTQMGRSLALWLLQLDPHMTRLDTSRRALLDQDLRPLTHACAHAAAAWALGLTPDEGLQALGWSLVEAQVSAAVRLIPLGQTAGQQLLQALGARLPAAVARTRAAPCEICNFAPMLGLYSTRHESQYSRLFRS